jgi:hypothetical protein
MISSSSSGTFRADLYHLPPTSTIRLLRYISSMLLSVFWALLLLLSGFYDTENGNTRRAKNSVFAPKPNNSLNGMSFIFSLALTYLTILLATEKCQVIRKPNRILTRHFTPVCISVSHKM